MRNSNHLLIGMMTILMLSTCDRREIPVQKPLLVVEGFIDDGGFPQVMLTTTLPISEELQSTDSISEHLLRWAKVTVSDDEQEVVLTGMVDNSYFPPFIYTTSRLRGKSGRNYTLHVDYEDYHVSAVTTIPEIPVIDTLVVTCTEVDSLFGLSVYLRNNFIKNESYMTFVCMGARGKQWLPSYLGLTDNVTKQSCLCITVNRPRTLTNTQEYTPFFCKGDTLIVKIAHIDEQAYLFWKDYENSTNFSRNPLFPFSQNNRSNIVGGVGCWYGCGAIKIPVIIGE